MAANKFASMLHKNCHMIMVILIYALLEWILILLLLLNSFFSYLIAKFSNFFGLRPSCTWCSKLDHVFDTRNVANSHFDHVCEAHGAEIGKLSYCSNHKRLAESQKLCSNCSSSSPQTENEISSTVAFFTSLSEGVSDTGKENCCSCCGEIFSRKIHPSSLIFKPSWDVLDCIRKRGSLSHEDLMKHIEFGEKGSENDNYDQLNSDGCPKREVVEVQEWGSSQNDDPFWRAGCNEDDESVYLADMLLQNADYTDSDRFICIELIDTPSVSSSQQPLTNSSEDVEDEQGLSIEEANRRSEVQEGSDVDTTESIFPESEEKKDYNETNNAVIGLHEEQESSNQGHKDCLDGSLISEMEVDDLSREDLKSIIRDQEKALKALYAELEEERKAAEAAAKETMAMITKVQEEKAAIQIEAVQYQRMMEEQAEYDQEALQLLNDLMMKREKEKKELEKELETYRNKFMDYEAKETDDHSVDLDSEDDWLEETGEECVRDPMIPDVTLTEFDEERVSILEEVKALEAKLLALHDEDDEREREGHIGKKLLPLFDDHERETTTQNSSKILIQEELGYVYERLQALEEDKEFLEHCIRSMMKGNKGLYLLQEILQHLRYLKSGELSARNLAQIL